MDDVGVFMIVVLHSSVVSCDRFCRSLLLDLLWIWRSFDVGQTDRQTGRQTPWPLDRFADASKKLGKVWHTVYTASSSIYCFEQ